MAEEVAGARRLRRVEDLLRRSLFDDLPVRKDDHVVGHTPDKLQVIGAAIADFFGDTAPAANTLIGVQALALPEFLIEVEATAVLA